MKRGEPPRRKTPLRAKQSLRASSAKRRRAEGDARDGWPPDVAREIEQRSGGRCELWRVRGNACWWRAAHKHHRWRKSQGGPNTAANALHLCVACHHYVHNDALASGESIRRGWILRRGIDPDLVVPDVGGRIF